MNDMHNEKPNEERPWTKVSERLPDTWAGKEWKGKWGEPTHWREAPEAKGEKPETVEQIHERHARGIGKALKLGPYAEEKPQEGSMASWEASLEEKCSICGDTDDGTRAGNYCLTCQETILESANKRPGMAMPAANEEKPASPAAMSPETTDEEIAKALDVDVQTVGAKRRIEVVRFFMEKKEAAGRYWENRYNELDSRIAGLRAADIESFQRRLATAKEDAITAFLSSQTEPSDEEIQAWAQKWVVSGKLVLGDLRPLFSAAMARKDAGAKQQEKACYNQGFCDASKKWGDATQTAQAEAAKWKAEAEQWKKSAILAEKSAEENLADCNKLGAELETAHGLIREATAFTQSMIPPFPMGSNARANTVELLAKLQSFSQPKETNTLDSPPPP